MSKTYKDGHWYLMGIGGQTYGPYTYHSANAAQAQARAAALRGELDGKAARQIAMDAQANARRLAYLAAEEQAKYRQEVEA